MRVLVILLIVVAAVGVHGHGAYTSVGCYKDWWIRAISGGWENFNPHTAVRDCYNKAKRLGNTYFAVQNNRECFTSRNAGSTYAKYGRGGGCRHGRGGGFRNDVYKINGGGGQQAYTSLGCYKDRSRPRAISGGWQTFNPGSAIEDCYNKAKRLGNTYFAVQNNKECFTSRDAGSTYAKYGRGGRCRHGRGGGYRNDVYKINGLPAPTGITVSYVTTNNQLSFRVKFTRSIVKPSTYKVNWYTTASNTVIYTQTLTTGDESILPGNNPSFRLGISVYTKIQYWYNDNPTLKSTFTESKKFYAGVKVNPNTFTIVSGKTVQVQVSLTVPIFCQGGATDCSITVQLASPRRDILIICPYTVVFTATTWSVVQTVTFKTIKDTRFTGVVVVPIKVMIIPQPTVLFLTTWTQHVDIKMTVNRHSVNPGGRSGRCISTGDPHLTTFDGQRYNHYRVGDYVLVKSKIRDFQVHVRTHKCGRVSCNCGVVVKEGPDVMAVNFCGNYYSPFVGYLSKKEPQPGTGIERNGNGKDFKILTSSGAYVAFKSKSKSVSDLSIHVPGIDFRHVVGMCGTFDGNRRNDQQKPNGQHVGGNGSPTFTESWRVKDTESLFFYEDRATAAITTTNVAVAADVCLPDLKCSFALEKPKNGHKILGFPGLAKCEKDRGEKPDPNIIVTPPGDFDGYEGVDPDGDNFKPVIPNWPTPSGITVTVARSLCYQKLTTSATFHTCKKLLGAKFTAQVTATLPQCIADIKILDNKELAFAASLQAILDFCQEGVNDKPDAVTELEEKVCPNECSGKGQCVKGVCVCNKGYGTEDCSVYLNQVPELVISGCGTLCDTRMNDCTKVAVRSKKLVPDRVKCSSGLLSVTRAEVLNFAEVICVVKQSDQRLLKDGGSLSVPRYFVRLSNNGRMFSKREWMVTAYDSKCMVCQCLGHQARCTLKANTCMINGQCYANGEADPNDRQCGVCNPATSTSSFVKSGFGPWKAWSSCSKPCNGGVQNRVRVCTGMPACCTGKTEETRSCNQQSCVNPHPQPGIPDGTWNFHFGTNIFKFTASNGQVTIGGQPITFSPGQHGWWQFIYGPIKYYINFSPTDIQVYAFLNGQPVTGTVTKALPDFILAQIAKHPGTWDFKFSGTTFKLVITNGKLTIGGQPITLVASDNPNKPTSSGWVKFSYGPFVYYVKFTSTTIEVVASMFDNMVPGTVTKATPAPVHQNVPAKILDWLRAHFGTWSINIGANPFKISIAYGKIAIGGQPITLTASDNINYPTNGQAGGWVKFNYASTVYYIHFPTNIEWVGFTGGNPGAGSLPNQGKQVPAYVTTWLSQQYGSWGLPIGGSTQQFAIHYGKVTFGGHPVTLMTSDNLQYQTSRGWLRFISGHLVCYIKFPITIEVVAFVGGKPVAARVTKEAMPPVSQWGDQPSK